MAPRTRKSSLLEPSILRAAAISSLVKLDPRLVARNPVMFVVEVGSLLMTLLWLRDRISPPAGAAPGWFTLAVSLWLWFTVVFANFAEAVAEGRGKAQADTLRKMRKDVDARRIANGTEERVPAASLRKGDVVVVEAGQMIPGDGEVIEGVASVNESAITGESAPVIRESGGDRSAVTGGTTVLSDRILVRITANPGESFLDRMIGLVEGAARQKTPNEIALHILLVGLTLVFPVSVLVLSGWAAVVPQGTSSLANAGPHGLSEILYAFTSGAANNGSAFAGLDTNTPFWNVGLGVDMLLGRFFMIVPALAIGGAMVAKKSAPPGPGTFPTGGPTFVLLLVSVILVVGALTFFPALSLGPVLEHFAAQRGRLF
jgi:hypothetical protein